jgi:hypothetical protein
LAREALGAPIKTHLTVELTFNYFFHNDSAEPARPQVLDQLAPRIGDGFDALEFEDLLPQLRRFPIAWDVLTPDR